MFLCTTDFQVRDKQDKISRQVRENLEAAASKSRRGEASRILWPRTSRGDQIHEVEEA